MAFTLTGTLHLCTITKYIICMCFKALPVKPFIRWSDVRFFWARTLPYKSLETLAKCGFGRYQHKSLAFFGANTLK